MLILASDHAGFELKEYLKQYFDKNGIDFEDCGALKYDAQDDYPDIANKAIKRLLQEENSKAILICGSGVGMSMVANRYKGIRAVLAYDKDTVIMARKHNNANVLCLGARKVSKRKNIKLILTFLTTTFDGGKHLRRINKF